MEHLESESDQGTYLTASKVQKLVPNLDIQWNFHLVYNPTATRNRERPNELIKIKLKTKDNKTTLQEILNWAAFNLNQRERLGRPKPHDVLTDPLLTLM